MSSTNSVSQSFMTMLFISSLFYSTQSHAATIQVGPERTLKKPSEAASVVKDGDIVEIDSGTYACDGGVKWEADDLTIIGVGPSKPVITWEGCNGFVPGGKGLWNPQGHNFRVKNIEFSGAKVSSANGAGIRFDGTGLLAVEHSIFRGNQNGLLITPLPNSDVSKNIVSISHSELAFNGYKDGRSHNIYVTENVDKFTFVNNYSHNADTGHLVKSIARINHIMYNKLEDGHSGNSSYHIDLPAGGLAYVIGNIMIQEEASPNQGILSFAAETTNPDRNHAEKQLYVVNNTVINRKNNGTFIYLFDHHNDFEKGVYANNLLLNLPQSSAIDYKQVNVSGSITSSANLYLTEDELVSTANHNFQPKVDSSAVDAGVALNSLNISEMIMPVMEYKHYTISKYRLNDDKVDVGAIERDGENGTLPNISLSGPTAKVPYDGSATISWEVNNAYSCYASGDWQGSLKPENGQLVINNLTMDSTYTLNCDGENGSTRVVTNIEVELPSYIMSLPDITAVTLANTKIAPFLDSQDPFTSGVMKAWSTETINTAYSAQNKMLYVMGGGQRSYFGNEIVGLNLDTLALESVFERTPIRDLTHYKSTYSNFWAMFPWGDCQSVWETNDGILSPSSRNLFGGLSYVSGLNSLYIQGGFIGCTSNTQSYDSWLFDLETRTWQLIANDSALMGTTVTQTTLLEGENKSLIAHNKGVYSLDLESFNVTNVDTSAPYFDSSSATSIFDKANNLVVYVGAGKISVYDMDKLSSDGAINVETDWQISGDLSILDSSFPGVTYHTGRNVIVAWGGEDRLYYLEVDKANKSIEIFGQPLTNVNLPITKKHNIFSSFKYIPELNGYIIVLNSNHDMILLKEE